MGSYRKGLLRQVDAWFGRAGFRSRHPAIIVMPLLDQRKDPTANFGGKMAGRSWQDAVIVALRQVMAQCSVDPARVYVTGNSLGGMGTWDMLLAYNAQTGTKGRIFAAGMPLAGRHHTADPATAAQALRTVPIWVFHGRFDQEEPLAWDRTMARLLADSRTFRYTEVSDLGHDVWSQTYARPDVWDWLFAQRSDQ
jgi:predicted peptidase